ncbi:MAG: TRAP transporter TatT component family protein [Nitrospirota bacterium]|nr:TRAP transporter TatT component family protein [Nitrospirota bacterium]
MQHRTDSITTTRLTTPLRPWLAILAGLALVCALPACSVKRIAVGSISNALSGDPSVSFTSEEDPELVRDAMPFGLKTYESLLENNPEHRGMLLTTAQAFVVYAYLLQDEADRMSDDDIVQARAQRQRASRLYLRGRDYALRGLDVEHKGFSDLLRKDRKGALAMTGEDDVPYLYWAGAGWAGALGAKKGDLLLLVEMPIAGALVQRVIELDETFDGGAAHEFMVSWESGRPGGSMAVAREHYTRAVELGKGKRVGIHLTLAESVSVPEQNLDEFKRLVDQVLSFDLNSEPEQRLANTLAQRRAKWLSGRLGELFLDAE